MNLGQIKVPMTLYYFLVAHQHGFSKMVSFNIKIYFHPHPNCQIREENIQSNLKPYSGPFLDHIGCPHPRRGIFIEENLP